MPHFDASWHNASCNGNLVWSVENNSFLWALSSSLWKSCHSQWHCHSWRCTLRWFSPYVATLYNETRDCKHLAESFGCSKKKSALCDKSEFYFQGIQPISEEDLVCYGYCEILWRVRVDFCWQQHVRNSSVAPRHFKCRVLTARVPMEIQERPQGRPVSDSPQEIHCFLHQSLVQRGHLNHCQNQYHLCYTLFHCFEDEHTVWTIFTSKKLNINVDLTIYILYTIAQNLESVRSL